MNSDQTIEKSSPSKELMVPEEAGTEGYRRIFKSSSMLGGSQGVCYLIGLARTKAIAYLLGPAGVGLVGLYSSIGATLGTLTGLGFGESSVREIAAAHGTNDPEKISRAAIIVRRACLLSGALGVLMMVLFSKQLSFYSFGSTEHSVSIALLGITLLLGAYTSGEIAVLQGSGRFVEMAKMNIVSSLISILPVFCVYFWWREEGIVAAMILTSFLSAVATGIFAKAVSLKPSNITWAETFRETKPLVYLGAAFMLTGLLWSGKDMIIRSSITKWHGLDSAGLFQSAWVVSGLFVNFVLRAMGMDFYPRLTSMIDSPSAMQRAVNQQIEIGVLLAIPGVVATITCAPLVILILYSSKFQGAGGLLAVMSCGVFFKVISYPLNLIQLAKGDARGFATFGIILGIAEAAATVLLLKGFGLMGAALAFPIFCFIHVVAMTWVGRSMIGFRYDPKCLALLFTSLGYTVLALLIAFCCEGYAALLLGLILSVFCGIFSLKGLISRLGGDHRIVVLLKKLPGGSRMF